MTTQALLQAVQAIIDTRPTYRIGGSGVDGTCDCIGLIIGAVRRAGGKWTGDHSSNWAPRRAMATLRDIHTASDVALGDLLYKCRMPGQPGYSLPARFQGGADNRDYYHVGIVTSTQPLRITHCTSWSGGSGIMVDSKLGQWRRGGQLAMITAGQAPAQEVEQVEPQIMVVTAETGRTVRLRAQPSSKGIILANVPIGAHVQATEHQGEWQRVRWAGKVGWMMAQHLSPVQQPTTEPQQDIDRVALWMELEGLLNRAQAIAYLLRGAG